MDAVPVGAVAGPEEAIVQRVLQVEGLPAGGHNTQRRHDLRQLGLALVMSEAGEIRLRHVLYEEPRPDGATFAAVLEALRQRLQRLIVAQTRLTLISDQGAESAANLAAAQPG